MRALPRSTRLNRQRISAYLVDVTAPDVPRAGLVVQRVVAPELCPLDVSHRALQGGERLTQTAFEAGLVQPLTLDDLNPLPHPFP